MKSLIKWGLYGLAVVAAAVALLVFSESCRAAVLTALAKAWVVNDAPEKADVIYALGGGLPQRPQAAARLFKEGYAPRVLYSDVKHGWAVEAGFSPSEGEITRRLLLKEGVPAQALEPLGRGLSSTYEETRALREWVVARRARRVIVVTDLFHTRRAERYFQKALSGTGADLRVIGESVPAFQLTNWWKTEEGLLYFNNEVIKSAYYWVHY